MIDIAPIDIAVIFLYLGVVLAIGFWAGRGERDAEDYFLAARALPWYLIGFSFFASNMSGASFVGLMGAAYQEGMVVFNYEWTATLVLIVFALVMLPTFLRTRLFTVPEYLEVRFDRRARWAYAGLTLMTLLLIDMAGAIYAGGVVITTAFPQVGLWETSIGLAVLAGGYTLFGGLRAVVVTDALQAVLMILGAGAIVWFGLEAVGGWSALMAQMGEAERRLFRPSGDAFLPWHGIGGVILLGFYYWTLNQYFVQRALAARSLDEGRKGALFGGLLKLPNVLLMIVPGMIAIVLLPDLGNPDRVFPVLAFELLPIGFRGLVFTALIAAIMSSLDSAMNAAASLITMDFVRARRPATSGRALLVIGRLSTGVLIVVAAVYAPLIARFGSLFQYFQSTLAYIVPPVVAVYFAGLLWRRMTPAGAFWGLVGGLGFGLASYLAKEVTGVWAGIGLPPYHFTTMAMAIFVLSLALAAGISLARPAPLDGRTRETLFRAADLAPDPRAAGRPWWTDHRVQAAGLAMLMIALIVVLL